jgi:hypothetical protein
LGVASMIYNKFVRAGMALIKLDNNKVCWTVADVGKHTLR